MSRILRSYLRASRTFKGAVLEGAGVREPAVPHRTPLLRGAGAVLVLERPGQGAGKDDLK
jgi:hypothetical protein